MKEGVEGSLAGANGVGGGQAGEVGLRRHPLTVVLYHTCTHPHTLPASSPCELGLSWPAQAHDCVDLMVLLVIWCVSQADGQ